ncbi:G2/M phase-specific E3 ubiquitin-protein ligase-like [Carassius auratus]|uniref:G2/M phase-specific E3 ubiquitin-protein ligase-like n=1 Tax=Carassius auratus TaxID=7957 RepID=A0A6P6NL76_CARAU|nr:G2/M phase-specific E3 ubiquitin-protein ligase-like [Carassius auratus]
MSLWNMFIGGLPALLTAHQITDLFKVSFSEQGSSRRLEEERAVGQWRDWLIDIEGGDVVLTIEEEVRVTFVDLMFATGTNRIPPLGFDPVPTLAFLHDPVNGVKRVFPEANTCGLILRLPIYDSFSSHTILGIVQSPHFGLA